MRKDDSDTRLRHGWASVVLAATALSAMDTGYAKYLVPAPTLAHVTLSGYFYGTFVANMAAALLHLIPLWAILAVLPAGRVRAAAATVIAAGVGYLWQETIAHGDGLVALPSYVYVRWGLLLGFSLGLAAAMWFVFVPGHLPDVIRRWLGVALVTFGLVFDVWKFPSYHAFHGYLACINVAGVAWALSPSLTRVGPRWVAVAAILGTSLIANHFAPYTKPIIANVRGHGRMARDMLSTLPFTKNASFHIEPLVNANQRLSKEERKDAEKAWEKSLSEMGRKRLGKNVILLVLESTRADVWADPQVTKQFHRYRAQGTYVPMAVAQYPATPLAYGAMFTSLPPSVLVQNPFWAKDGFAAHLKNAFDTRLLTQPTNAWFDSTAISRFIVSSKNEKIHRHRNTAQALSWLREHMEKQKPDESFFAWAHLYDPHQPYTAHRGFNFGTAVPQLYRSEVAFLDASIAPFVDWFYASPRAADTLLIIVGDHGEGLGEKIDGAPFIGHHIQVENFLSHVPFYISGPGVPKGQMRTDLHVAQMDLMPTVWDFLGLPLPKTTLAEGRSFFAEVKHPEERPLITEAFSIRGPDFFNFVAAAQRKNADSKELAAKFAKINENDTYTPKVAMQLGHWKLIRDMLIDQDALYDVAKDPTEQKNLSKTNSDDFDRMRDALEAWRTQQAWVLQRAAKLEADRKND